MTIFKALIRDDAGATAIEYGLIAALIAISGLIAMQNMGGQVKNSFQATSDKMDCAATSSC